MPDEHDYNQEERSDERLRLLESIVSNANDSILVTEAEFIEEPGPRIVFVNESFTHMTGYSPEEIIGKTPRILQGPKTDRAQLDKIRTALSKDESVRVELLNYREDGTEFWVELNIVPGRKRHGRTIHYISIQRDISERKRIQKELKESEERLRTILIQYASDMITILEPDGTILYQSPAVADTLGYLPEGLVGESFFDYVHPEDVERITRELAEVLGNPGPSPPIEVRARHVDGSWRYLEGIVNNLIDDPAVGRIVISSRDVTERKEAEEGYRSIFENAAEGIYQTTPGGRLSSANPALACIFGYDSPEEMVSELTDVEQGYVVPGRREEFFKLLRENSHLSGFEYQAYRKDGSIAWLSDSAREVCDEEGELLCYEGFIQDITARKRAEEALKKSHDLLQAVMEGTTDAVFVKDLQGRYLTINQAGAEALGERVEDVIGKDDTELFEYEDGREVIEADREIMTTGETRTIEDTKMADGVTQTFLATKGPYRDASGNVAGMFGVARDITKRKSVEEALKKSENSLQAAQRMAHVGNWERVVGRDLYWSDELYRIYGFTPQQFVPTYEAFLRAIHPDDRDYVEKTQEEVRRSGERSTIECRLVQPDGEVRIVQNSYETDYDETGELTRIAGTVQDITERKMLEERLEYQASHDVLTGLPNRALFSDRLRHTLAGTRRRDGRVAVLFLDLDNFKIINDTLGHEMGDRLLISVAESLKKCLRPGDSAAHFSGDEFTVLLEDIKSVDEAKRVAERILEELRSPVALDGNEVLATVSIGITLSSFAAWQPPDTTQQSEDLLRQADMAMYKAKQAGRAHYEVFDGSLEASALKRLRLGYDLQRALDKREFRVYYQPVVGLDTSLQRHLRISGSRTIVAPQRPQDTRSRIIGMEALLRWEHPELGLLLPNEFIPIAEESGLIVPIGQWVLEQACRQAHEWQQKYLYDPPLLMSVNFSAKQFQEFQGDGIVEDFTRVLRETGLDPSSLGLEITENTVMEDRQSVVGTLQELKALGVKLIVDDFGVGYSSLSYLKKFPFDTLKIDRSFIKDLTKEEDPQNQRIVSSVLSLAHALNMEVVGEGIESASLCARLRALGCEMGQGNYFSEPLPAGAANALLAKDPRW